MRRRLGGGGFITEGELNRGFTVFSNTPYEKSAYQYIAVGVIRHLHLTYLFYSSVQNFL